MERYSAAGETYQIAFGLPVLFTASSVGLMQKGVRGRGRGRKSIAGFGNFSST